MQQPADVPGAKEAMPELFIGRIPQGLPKEYIESSFAPYGAFNIRVLENKGCAFATFSSWTEAERAIAALNGACLTEEPGEGINVKFADIKGAPKGKQAEAKVFIGGLNSSATEDHVAQLCLQYGHVIHTKIWSKSAGSPPCAFVTYSSFSEAEICINALHGAETPMALEGKTLNVRMADAGKGQKAGAGAGLGAGGPPPAATPMLPQRRVQAAAPPPQLALATGYAQPQAQMGGFGKGDGPPRGCGGGFGGGAGGGGGGVGPKVFIGGLPETATEQFVWGMMAPFGEVVEAKVHRKMGAQPCGFALFSQLGCAERAVAALADQGRYVVRYAEDGKGKRQAEGAMGDGFQKRFRG